MSVWLKSEKRYAVGVGAGSPGSGRVKVGTCFLLPCRDNNNSMSSYAQLPGNAKSL